MQVGKVFYEVGTHTLPAVCREKTHMVDVNTLAAFKENAEQSLFNGLVRSERCRVFLPFVARHSDCSLADRAVFFVDKFYAELGFFALQGVQTGIDRKVIMHAFLQSHAEETAVFKARPFLTMPRIGQCYVVGIAVESRLDIAHGDITEGVPTH